MRDYGPTKDGDADDARAFQRALWLRLVHLNRAVSARLRENLRACGDMTLPQFEVLTALREAPGGLRMSGLSEALHVSNGNVTGIIERLVETGLVQRAEVPDDRRATLVRLTERGEIVQAELAARHDAALGLGLGGIDRNDASAMIALLDTISAGGPSPAP